MKLPAALQAFAERIKNWWHYDGAIRWSPERSYIYGQVQDARFDANSATRLELVRKSRAFERNNALVNKMADLWECYVGPLQMTPASSDEDWNSRAQVVWDEWQRVCDVSSRQNFQSLQKLLLRSWFIDGEVFILKTRGREVSLDGRALERPRVQLVEAHQVATPAERIGGTNIVDGIELNENGRPVAYWIRDQFADTFRRYDAKDVIHLFDPSRAGMYRGLPYVYPVVNDIIDLDDLQRYEMKAAKDAADITNVVHTESGELNPGQMRRERFSIKTQDAAGNETTEQRTQYIQNRIGGRTIALKPNEKIEQFKSDRPSVVTQGYWDFLTAKICAGVGIPKLVVLSHSLQGTVVRGEFDLAHAFFRSKSGIFAEAIADIYLFVMGWHVRNDRRVVDPPSDWYLTNTRAPRAINVDVGRNSSAIIAEYEAGLRTLEGICAEMGQDWRRHVRQRAREEAFVDKSAREEGTTPERIKSAVVKALAASQGQAQGDQSLLSQPQAET